MRDKEENINNDLNVSSQKKLSMREKYLATNTKH